MVQELEYRATDALRVNVSPKPYISIKLAMLGQLWRRCYCNIMDYGSPISQNGWGVWYYSAVFHTWKTSPVSRELI